MSWVPFHSSLREGDKRGLPRAVRFVYLELSLLTRPSGGRLPLPRGFKSDLDAVHDILGGDRREIRAALELLTTPLDPTDPRDEPMLRLSGPPERRILELPAHKRWVRPDTTAERVRRHRNRGFEQSPLVGESCNANEGVSETPSPVTDVTGQRRGEERRGKEREETQTAAPAAPAGSSEPSITDPPPTKPGTIPLHLEPGSAAAKSPEADVFDHWVRGWKRIVRGTRVPRLDDKRRGKIRARLAEKFTVGDLKQAIDGMWATPWNVENRYYDIELVCRDGAHVDRFMASAPRSVDDETPAPPKGYDPPATPAQVREILASAPKPKDPTDPLAKMIAATQATDVGAPVFWTPKATAEGTKP